MADWEFECSEHTKAKRAAVWDYWSDLDHFAELDPGIERIELDGETEAGDGRPETG